MASSGPGLHCPQRGPLLLKAYNAVTKSGGFKPYKSKAEALGFLVG